MTIFQLGVTHDDKHIVAKTDTYQGRVRTRLYAGPFDTLAEADAARRKAEILHCAREAFLCMVADASRWVEDADEGTLDYHFTVGHHQLRDLCEALDIRVGYTETPGAAIARELAKDDTSPCGGA